MNIKKSDKPKIAKLVSLMMWIVIFSAVTGCGGGASSSSVAERCGDGNVSRQEACDDGNIVSGDGCSAQCLTEYEEQSMFRKVHDVSYYDYGKSVIASEDGSFIVGGYVGSSSYRGYISKFSTIGSIDWSYSLYISNNGDKTLNSIFPTDDGGYIGTGYSRQGNYGIWVVKLSSTGTIEWEKTLSDGIGSSIVQAGYGGYIVAGQSRTNGSTTTYYPTVIKLDEQGDVEWEKVFTSMESGSANSGNAITISENNALVVAGCGVKERQYGNSYDAWLARISATGETLWEKFFGDSHSECFNGIISTPEGDFIAAGNTSYYNDGWVIKVDANGKRIWVKTIGQEDQDERIYSICPAADGGYALGGEISGSAGIFKIDSSGNEKWTKEFSSISGLSKIYSIAQAIDNGYIATGIYYSNSYSSSTDVLLLKLNALGACENCVN